MILHQERVEEHYKKIIDMIVEKIVYKIVIAKPFRGMFTG